MTHLEIILIGIVWVFIGIFICHKRNWYKHYDAYDERKEVMILFTIICSPMALIVALFREFLLDDWNNKLD